MTHRVAPRAKRGDPALTCFTPPERYRSTVIDASDTTPGVTVPDLTFLGGHPCVPDPARPGGYVCVACEAVGGSASRACVPGLVVHLIDEAEIAEHPDRWKRSPWANAETLASARRWWTGRGAQITRAHGGHDRFQVCAPCTVLRMRAGEIRIILPDPSPPVIIRKR